MQSADWKSANDMQVHQLCSYGLFLLNNTPSFLLVYLLIAAEHLLSILHWHTAYLSMCTHYTVQIATSYVCVLKCIYILTYYDVFTHLYNFYNVFYVLYLFSSPGSENKLERHQPQNVIKTIKIYSNSLHEDAS